MPRLTSPVLTLHTGHPTSLIDLLCGLVRLGKLHSDLGMDSMSLFYFIFIFFVAGDPSVRSQGGRVLVPCEGVTKEGGACLDS